MQLTIGILLFDGVEVLDFAGPFEVFSVASRIAAVRGFAAPDPFQVLTVSRDGGRVMARHGLQVLASAAFADHPAIDVLIVPGGVVDAALADPAILAWISQTAGKAQLTASICTGAFLLADAGLLDGRRATTHWEDIDALRARSPQVRVIEDVAFVDEGDIVTSAGISAGIDMSLHLVGRLLGEDAAVQTARQMQYDRRAASTSQR
ncbi:Isonitrile hydratase [Brevundimonas sp. SH203]|uniref:DJ-1/PfpI family protein n=1 Tax=Brevundimonas sp. SH203 TaxID=345167 RepID=UPI0009C8A88D|nr:DJ-1/PfpI family protein [Brevundimonas sp. SH203]GAW41811.1 Isonitrile hydratase [Brevundimonas sp. SH203]